MTLDELLARASLREPMKTSDSKSGASFERVVIDGEPHVLKHFDPRSDWLMRASGDFGCRAVALHDLGLYAAQPPCIDHTVVAAGHRALLMRDVAPYLIPEGDSVVPLATHRRLLEAMALQHRAFEGWRDEHGLIPMATRFTLLSPATGRFEAGTPGVPSMLVPSWEALFAARPHLARVVEPLLDDPWPLVSALEGMPATFLHGDWKYGNLGLRPDGTVILLDWDRPGEGPPAFDLTWYLAVNCDRLPESKEAAIEAYRSYLGPGEEWERQLELCLLGAFLQLGWSKSGPELDWWEPHVLGVAL